MSGREPGLVVRRASAPDAQAIFALQEELFAGDVNRLSVEQLRALDGDKQIIALVAELDGAVAGFLILRNRGTRPWTGIDFVGVAPRAAGRGIGGKLLEAALIVSPRPMLRLFVRPSNAAARALYARLGFRHTATRKASYEDGEDALVQMKWAGFRRLRRNSPMSQRLQTT